MSLRPRIDPFSSWPDGPSSCEEPCSSSELSTFKKRRESFLSLNSSSSNLSLFAFPAVPWSHPPTTAFAEYRVPLSPSPYSQSSSSWDREEEEEEAERGVVEDEEGMPSYSSDDQETCDWDAPATIDWRQFHVHLSQIANDTKS
jgi:hypothetical protein